MTMLIWKIETPMLSILAIVDISPFLWRHVNTRGASARHSKLLYMTRISDGLPQGQTDMNPRLLFWSVELDNHALRILVRMRRDELVAISGPNEFAEFNSRLKQIKEFHRKHPNEVSDPLLETVNSS